MKKFFLALYTQLQNVAGLEPNRIRMWNDQLNKIDQGKMELFDMPAVFIEFVTSDIMQLGEGRQLYEPFLFKLHILHKQLDAADGTFEQNLDVYDFKDAVFKVMQKFQPGLSDSTTPAGSCIRVSEEQDYNHGNVYHFIQSYRSTFVEEIAAEPVDGIDGPNPPLPVEIDETNAINVQNAVPYDPTVQYLAVNDTIVVYSDQYYQILTDTPNPAGPFNANLWTLLTNVYNYTPAP